MGPSSGGSVRTEPRTSHLNPNKKKSRRLVELPMLLLAVCALATVQAAEIPPLTQLSRVKSAQPLRLSHHALCEPISQLEDLRLSCPHPESQFIVFLEAYYSDLYPEKVCPQVMEQELKLKKLTGSQLVSIFRQLYTTTTTKTPSSRHKNLIKLNPTLNIGSQTYKPLCFQDMKQSFMAKCSGQRECQFSRSRDHTFPDCVRLRPGHVFARYLCIDDSLLLRYCNADTLLASHTSTLSRVRRSPPAPEGRQHERVLDKRQVFVGYDDAANMKQVDTPDFGFVATPGYPSYYATTSHNAKCGWTIEAELGQRVEVKLLDASMAPRKQKPSELLEPDYSSIWFGSDPTDGPNNAVGDSGELRLTHNARSELVARPYLQPDVQVQQGGGGAGRGSNVQFEKTHEQTTRTVFKIDELDYESMRTELAAKLQQISEQCQGYDQLVVRDSYPAAPLPFASMLSDQPAQPSNGVAEMDLISKLPITLFKNNLIDFSNQSVYYKQAVTDGNQDQDQDMDNRGDELPRGSKRLDYTALLSGLNPLQLAWLYQHNVTLCSLSQQDELSSPQQKSKISFRSTGNTIRLDLISGHMFNPLNRGVLFWYHKHGCPATRQAPPRTRLLFQNETTEIFRCYEGFVFADTRQSVRAKYCSELDQRWHDTAGPSSDDSDTHFPACEFVEELAYAASSPSPAESPLNGSAKFDRLVLAAAGNVSQEQQRQQYYSRLFSDSEDVTVELVGVSTRAPPHGQSNPTGANNHNYISDEVELLAGNLRASTAQGGNSGNLQDPRATPGFLSNVLDWLGASGTSPGSQPAGSSGDSSVPVRSIMTHRPLREERLPGQAEATFWQKLASLFDRRYLAPAMALLFLFILLNFIIYVIFLVAIPKFARCFCPLILCSDNKQKSRHATCNGSAHHHYHDSSQANSSTKPFCHYESDYSVTMGMSL